MSLTGFSNATSGKILLDGGVLYVAGTKLGALRGGSTFDPGIEITEIGYDGQRAPTAGMDRKTFARPVITGTMIEMDETALLRLEPGGSAATAGTTGAQVVTITAHAMGELLAESTDYLTNVRVVFLRGDGKYWAVLFPLALVKKWSMTGVDKTGAEFAIEIEARHDPDDATSVVPYKLEPLRDAVPTA